MRPISSVCWWVCGIFPVLFTAIVVVAAIIWVLCTEESGKKAADIARESQWPS
jgi:hypothetical protein